MAVALSYCVLNTEHRQLLGYCLDAIARERATVAFETETLVLDNASRDGSAEAARIHPATTHVIERERPHPTAENAAELLRHARGPLCLLLDEDSELEPGATAALHAALAGDDRAGAATATLLSPDGAELPSAWRFPRRWPPRRRAVQSTGTEVHAVDWAALTALLVRRDAVAAAGGLEGGPVALGRRLLASGWRVLYVPEARAVAHVAPARL
jgi:GT2 family glycosyltransferase